MAVKKDIVRGQVAVDDGFRARVEVLQAHRNVHRHQDLDGDIENLHDLTLEDNQSEHKRASEHAGRCTSFPQEDTLKELTGTIKQDAQTSDDAELAGLLEAGALQGSSQPQRTEGADLPQT